MILRFAQDRLFGEWTHGWVIEPNGTAHDVEDFEGGHANIIKRLGYDYDDSRDRSSYGDAVWEVDTPTEYLFVRDGGIVVRSFNNDISIVIDSSKVNRKWIQGFMLDHIKKPQLELKVFVLDLAREDIEGTRGEAYYSYYDTLREFLVS